MKNNPYKSGRDLSTLECKKAIDKFAAGGVKHIHLIGGEPFWRKDIFEICSYGKKRDIMVTINTNGMYLTEQSCRQIIDVGIDEISISIDGAVGEVNDAIRGNGTFMEITNNLKRLIKMRNELHSSLRVSIVFTMLNRNLHQIPLMLDFATDIGADGLDITELYPSGKAAGKKFKYRYEEVIPYLELFTKKLRDKRRVFPHFLVQLDSLLPLAKYLNRKYSTDIYFHARNMDCHAGDEMWYMQADGQLHPCGMCNNPLYNKEVMQENGYELQNINIKNTSCLKEIMESKYFQTFLAFKQVSKMKKRMPCSICEYNSICSPCPILYYKDTKVRECIMMNKIKRKFIEEMCKRNVIIKKM